MDEFEKEMEELEWEMEASFEDSLFWSAGCGPSIYSTYEAYYIDEGDEADNYSQDDAIYQEAEADKEADADKKAEAVKEADAEKEAEANKEAEAVKKDNAD